MAAVGAGDRGVCLAPYGSRIVRIIRIGGRAGGGGRGWSEGAGVEALDQGGADAVAAAGQVRGGQPEAGDRAGGAGDGNAADRLASRPATVSTSSASMVT